MLIIWIFCLLVFALALFYLWSQSKVISKDYEWIQGFIKGHQETSTFIGSRLCYLYFFLSVLVLIAGVITGYQTLIEPSLAYALLLMGLAVFFLVMSMRYYVNNLLVFYSKGFVWDQIIFPYSTIEIKDHQVIQEVPIPLNSRMVKEITRKYEQFESRNKK